MGKVCTVMKIYPEEGTEAGALAEEIRKLADCTKVSVEEIAFGAKVVMASFICEDSAGKDYEEAVRAVAGVSEAQVEECGLV
jgi:translation elongation factor EF-1beta